MLELKTILVTGGTGLVGGYLLMQLTQSENTIIAIYRNEKSVEKTKKLFSAYNRLKWFDRIHWKQANINDYFSLKAAFDNVDYVYHTAAKVSFHQHDVDEMMDTNINGTANIVNICLEKEVKKLCYVSSVAALGESKNGECITEQNDWINTSNTSNYSVSKYYAENEVWRGTEEGLNAVIVNPAYILGFGDWNESSLQIFKKVYEGLSYFSTGSNGFVDVEDVVNIMILLMESDLKNERYLICSENLMFKELFQMMAKGFNKNPPKQEVVKRYAILAYWFDQIKCKFTGQKPILTKESVNSAYSNKCYDSSKITEALNYSYKPIANSIQEATNKYLLNTTLQ